MTALMLSGAVGVLVPLYLALCVAPERVIDAPPLMLRGNNRATKNRCVNTETGE